MEKPKPVVGLALGSGAARGLAHIGVLKVFEREGIPVDLITGSSIGALVGAFYAAGMPLAIMEKFSASFDHKQWIDPILPRTGLMKGERVYEMIRLLTKGQQFADLRIPLGVVATDLRSGQRMTFREGNVADAVRASISIPGVFEPFRKDGMVLVDGGVLDRVPAALAREMGAEFVIAVDVGFDVNRQDGMRLNSIVDILIHSIDLLEYEAMKNKFLDADIIIKPEVHTVNPARFDHAEECVQAGIAAAEAVIPLIREQLRLEECTNETNIP